jgi:chromosome transmission fidelity protein 1
MITQGKSLSLICASLTWLRDHKRQRFEEGLSWDAGDSDEPDWIVEQARARKRNDLLRQREEMEARLAKIRSQEKAQRERYLKGEPAAKRRKIGGNKDLPVDESDAEQFMLNNYDSDTEHRMSKSTGEGSSTLSAETLALMEKFGMSLGPPKPEAEEEMEEEIQVGIFSELLCSLSHKYRSFTAQGLILS